MLAVVNINRQSVWCRAWILSQLLQRNHWNGLWEGKVQLAQSFAFAEWFYMHAEALIVQRGKNFRWRCYFNTVITQKGSPNSELYSCWDSERNRFFPRTAWWISSQTTSWDFIVLYRTFDWLDLKMFESIVSVLPSDWLSLSGWPRFQ